MPFIEDDNGLAIYFTRDEWKYILEVLEDDLVYHSGLIKDDSATMAGRIINAIERLM